MFEIEQTMLHSSLYLPRRRATGIAFLRRIKTAMFLILILTPAATWSSAPDTSKRSVFVVSHGWHTGVIVKKSQAYELAAMFEHEPGQYLEIGWGDRKFYQNPSPNIDYWLAARALFWPTSSVMHVVFLQRHPEEVFRYSPLIELKMEAASMRSLCDFIAHTFEHDDTGNLLSLGAGLYGNSCFYAAKPAYYYPNTCNVWTASALKKAGLPLNPISNQHASTLIKNLRKIINEQKENNRK